MHFLTGIVLAVVANHAAIAAVGTTTLSTAAGKSMGTAAVAAGKATSAEGKSIGIARVAPVTTMSLRSGSNSLVARCYKRRVFVILHASSNQLEPRQNFV